MKLKCAYCHKPSEKPDRARVLPDFVFFSHTKHTAKFECVNCHINIEKHEYKMKWCVDCHKQNKAAVGCNTCHELGQ